MKPRKCPLWRDLGLMILLAAALFLLTSLTAKCEVRSTVRIRSHGVSGVIIARWRGCFDVLSCAHQYWDGRLRGKRVRIDVPTAPGTGRDRPSRIETILIDLRADLTLYRVYSDDVVPVAVLPQFSARYKSSAEMRSLVGEQSNTRGANYYAWGYPHMGRSKRYVFTKVGTKFHTNRFAQFRGIVLAQPATNGVSGGPLFNVHGELCGICHGGFGVSPRRLYGVYVGPETIERFLRKCGYPFDRLLENGSAVRVSPQPSLFPRTPSPNAPC